MNDPSKIYQKLLEENALLNQRIKELQESESNYEMLFAGAAEGILIAELQTKKFVYANPAMCRMLGRTEEEISQLGVEDIHPKESLEQVLAMFDALARGEKTWVENVPRLRKDGTLFRANIGASLIVFHGKKCIVGFFTDITEYKQAENALRESDEKYRAILESIQEGYYEIDLAGNLTFFNDSLCRIIGYPREELMGMNYRQYEDKGSLKKVFEMYNKVYKTGEPIEGFYRQIIRKDGTKTYAESSVSLQKDSSGKPIGFRGFARDITERKQADAKLQQTLDRLRKSIGVTIQVMVSAIEVRDPYTAGHQKRVSDLARSIATEMGLDMDKIEGIRMAGSIHDIGKLAVPSEILTKPTKLTNLEFSLIKEHSQGGYEMLKDVESPWPLAQIVYQHHERINGSGYPRKLKGDEIIIEARIMAVADVVEAMASHRPYRPGLGLEAALEEIEKNKGILYDDVVADACLRLFREKGYQLK